MPNPPKGDPYPLSYFTFTILLLCCRMQKLCHYLVDTCRYIFVPNQCTELGVVIIINKTYTFFGYKKMRVLPLSPPGMLFSYMLHICVIHHVIQHSFLNKLVYWVIEYVNAFMLKDSFTCCCLLKICRNCRFTVYLVSQNFLFKCFSILYNQIHRFVQK